MRKMYEILRLLWDLGVGAVVLAFLWQLSLAGISFRHKLASFVHPFFADSIMGISSNRQAGQHAIHADLLFGGPHHS